MPRRKKPNCLPAAARKRLERARAKRGTRVQLWLPDLFGLGDWLFDQGRLAEWDCDNPQAIALALEKWIADQRPTSN
jgi:hypothetical protein